MNENSLEVVTAIQAITMASSLCQKVQKDLVAEVTLTKSDRSPVTIADYGSQAIICKLIKDIFPYDTIVAEEDSKELTIPGHSRILEKVTYYVNESIPNSSPEEVCAWIDSGSHSLADRFWALDPIDGTKGFLRGGQYAIALALIERGVVRLGLLACPNLYRDIHQTESEKGCLFFALRGKGSFQMDMKGGDRRVLSGLKVEDPSELFFTESYESNHSDHLFQQRIAQKLNITKPPLRMDSQAKYGIVARGEAVLYIRIPAPSEPGYRENIWDHAAGSIVAEEAGGRVTDALGHLLAFSSGIKMEKNYGIVVTNGISHDLVLKALGFSD